MSSSIDLPADPRWTPVATSVVHRVAGRLGFDVDRLDDVLLAVDEAITSLLGEADPDRILVGVDVTAGRDLVVTARPAGGTGGVSSERWRQSLAAALAGSLATEVHSEGLPDELRLVFAGP